MRFIVFFCLIVLLCTTRVTSFNLGQAIIKVPPRPALVPVGVSHSGYGANFGVLALAALIFNSLRQSQITTTVSVCPTRYRFHSTRCGNFCYRVENQNCRNFTDAQASCVADGGDLMNVDVCYYDFVVDVAKSSQGGCDRDFWVGATRANPASPFVTVRGDVISPLSVVWAPNEPNRNPRRLCAETEETLGFRLEAENCALDESYICQIFI